MEDDKVRQTVQNSDPATEPIDLAQAFKMYNQANRMPAEEPVEAGATEGGDGEPGVQVEGLDGQAQGAAEADGYGAAAVDDGGQEGGAGAPGLADVIEPVDYNPARESILKDVQQRAINDVREQFQREEISTWSINDLYEKDERTGRVRFRNPDDPDRDFSSRYEAQQFVDAMNKQITSEFRALVNKRQRELIQEEAPRLRTLEFASKYNAMDQTTKDIFEDLIEPYSIRDNGGNVIGFRVDLNAVAQQAEKIAKRFPKQQAPAQEPAAKGKGDSSGPALDMKTGASQNETLEPKSLGEALKMYDAKKRENNKKGK